jgi:hypothetical protein
MNILKFIGIFGIFIIGLQNTLADDSDNVMINIGLYENYNDCVSQTNILYEFNKSLFIKCNCLKSKNCYNKLIDSSTFKSYFFYYDNDTIPLYLYELNFKKNCYKMPLPISFTNQQPDLYVYNELDFSQYCGGIIIFSSLIIICMIAIVILSINYFINKRIKNKLLVTSPPSYKSLRVNT